MGSRPARGKHDVSHQQKQLNDAGACWQFRDRFAHPAHRRGGCLGAPLLPPRRRQRRDCTTWRSVARPWADHVPQPSLACASPLTRRPTTNSSRHVLATGRRRASEMPSNTMALVRILTKLHASDSRRGRRASSRSSPMRPAPSAWPGALPRVRHLLLRRKASSTTPSTSHSVALLQAKSQRRADHRGGHHRGGVADAPSWTAGTALSNSVQRACHDAAVLSSIYSMFGFQRVGDLIWAAADSAHVAASWWARRPAARRSTARDSSTRTAHSHVHGLGGAQPAVAYDPAYAYEDRGHRRRRASAACWTSRTRTCSTT
ncbi:hypothetical protein [Achromobacter marplatensis]|uniref:hypothetical protein n=1 Tax=Achromobacter marplatensis TaxID=470868 RepID=UPI003C7904C6